MQWSANAHQGESSLLKWIWDYGQCNNLTFAIIEKICEGIIKFSSKLGSRKIEDDLPFDQNVGWFTNLDRFFASFEMDEAIVIILHTTQVAQIANLPKVQAKTILDVGYDHLGPNITIVLFVHALHLRWGVTIIGHGGHLEQNVTIEFHG